MAAIFLQARLGSTRLSQKVTLTLGGKALIQQVVNRLKQCVGKEIQKIVIVTCQNSLKALSRLFQSDSDVHLFAGAEHNVLERFYEASLIHKDPIIIRATADNPFVSTPHIQSILEHHIKQKADLSHYMELPLGAGVEVIHREALHQAYNGATKDYQKEHVTPYLYDNRTHFKIEEPTVDNNFCRPDIRLTIDEPDDFRLAEKIFAQLGNENDFSLTEIIQLWDNELLSQINSHVQQKALI